jgi:hypothetical protein
MFRLSGTDRGLRRHLFSASILLLFFALILVHTEIPELLRLTDNTSNDFAGVSISRNSLPAPPVASERLPQTVPFTLEQTPHEFASDLERTPLPPVEDLLTLYSVFRT